MEVGLGLERPLPARVVVPWNRLTVLVRLELGCLELQQQLAGAAPWPGRAVAAAGAGVAWRPRDPEG